MGESAKGKGKHPGSPMPPIEVKSCTVNEQEKGKRMTKYPAAAQAISEEQPPHRLIDDIWEK